MHFPRFSFLRHRTPLQRRALVLIGLSLFFGFFLSRRDGGEAQSEQLWREVVAEANPAFRIAMPGTPEHQVHDVAFPWLGMTVRHGMVLGSDARGQRYLLAVASYPKGGFLPAGREELFNEQLQALFPDATDISVTRIPTADGMDFSVERFDGGPFSRGTLIVDGETTMYVLLSSAAPDVFSESAYRRFVDSFERPRA